MSPAPAGSGAREERYAALDIARGLAVLGMVWMHLVPVEGAQSVAGEVVTWIGRLVEGKPAALFCILAGAAWEIQSRRVRTRWWFLRRALALAAFGAVFHATVWPTEILLPLALMMVLALSLRRLGRRAIAALLILLLAGAPVLQAALGEAVPGDWGPDGTHVADRVAGWTTVRFVFFDGNYPLVPWLAFALLGMLMLSGGLPAPAQARRWLRLALLVLVPAQAWALWAAGAEDRLGALAPYVTATWVPTSVPFVLVAGGAAAGVLCLLLAREAALARRALRPLALIGRASLSHYILHIVAVIVPLRLAWPDEQWPIRVGLAAFAGYCAVAAPATVLWFRRASHGPLEGLWAAASGPTR